MKGVPETNKNFVFGERNVISSQDQKSLSELPDELLLRIFELLDILSLAAVSSTCKTLYRVGQDSKLWKYLCMHDFFDSYTKESDKVNKNWQNFYQLCAGLEYLQIPLPGKTGVFSVDLKKNWKPYFDIAPLMRELRLVNTVSDSIFISFTLFGYRDGGIAISLTFEAAKCNELKDYLKSIEPSYKMLTNFSLSSPNKLKDKLYISNFNLLRKILIVIKHSLPKETLCLFRGIIRDGNWKVVTPLTENELQEIELGRLAYEKARQLTWCEWIMSKLLGLDHLRLPMR